MSEGKGFSATMGRVFAVAGITFREAYRRKVFVAALVMSVGFLGLYAVGLYYAGKDIVAGVGEAGGMPGELMVDALRVQLLTLGLVPTSFIVSLTAIFATVGTISGELDTGVLHGVLARPIRRSELVAGKYLGLGVMLVVYDALLISAVVGLAVWQIDVPIDSLPAALPFFALEPLILAALALLGSTRLPTLANGVLCTAAYGIANVGGLIEQMGGLIKNAVMVNLGIVTSLLIPVDAMHRKAVTMLVPSGLVTGGAIVEQMGMGTPPQPSPVMVAYAALYCLAIVAFAARVFSRRDL